MWKDWTEPLEVLLAKAQEFLKQIDFSEFPRGGMLVTTPEIHTRKECIAKAFASYIAHPIGGFLRDYIYVSSVYEDVFDLVLEYIGECEHQQDLNGDEFAPTSEALIDDFALYIENWLSPHIKDRV